MGRDSSCWLGLQSKTRIKMCEKTYVSLFTINIDERKDLVQIKLQHISKFLDYSSIVRGVDGNVVSCRVSMAASKRNTAIMEPECVT